MPTHQITFRMIVRYFLICLAVGAFVAYTLFQARFILMGPVIVLNEIPSLQSAPVVELTGNATNISSINLNGRPIYTDKNGYFKEALVLENGYTVSTITGIDRYGRTSTVEASFIYHPVPALTQRN